MPGRSPRARLDIFQAVVPPADNCLDTAKAPRWSLSRAPCGRPSRLGSHLLFRRISREFPKKFSKKSKLRCPRRKRASWGWVCQTYQPLCRRGWGWCLVWPPRQFFQAVVGQLLRQIFQEVVAPADNLEQTSVLQAALPARLRSLRRAPPTGRPMGGRRRGGPGRHTPMCPSLSEFVGHIAVLFANGHVNHLPRAPGALPRRRWAAGGGPPCRHTPMFNTWC
jgi:hypothetical protein